MFPQQRAGNHLVRKTQEDKLVQEYCMLTSNCMYMHFPFYYVCSRYNEFQLHVRAGQSSYIAPNHLALVRNPGAIATAAWYQATTLLVKNKLQTSKLTNKRQEFEPVNNATSQLLPHPDGIVRDKDLGVYFLFCFSIVTCVL